MLRNNAAISSLLANFKGTSTPLVKVGVLPEVEDALPAITITIDNMLALDPVYSDETFIVNCFAATLIESSILARTIIDELDDSLISVDNYSMWFSSSGLGAVVNPTAKEINTPLTMRVIYRRD